MKVKDSEHGRVGFCISPLVLAKVKIPFHVCNLNEQAEDCACFECKNTEESVERDFDKVLKSPAWCGHEYPKLAMLLWMIQHVEDEEEDEEEVTRVSRFCESFLVVWKGFWNFVFFWRWW
jgi:hypothetical protein